MQSPSGTLRFPPYLLGLLLAAASLGNAPESVQPKVANLQDGQLTIRLPESVDRCVLEGGHQGVKVRWEGGEVQLEGSAARSLRGIRSSHPLRVTGTLRLLHELRIDAPRIRIVGRLRGPSFALRSKGWLEVESTGALCATGGMVELDADIVSLVGSVRAERGSVILRARNVLHAGSLEALSEPEAAGAVEIECDRYIGTAQASINVDVDQAGQAGTIRLLARTRAFTSARYSASGSTGGSVWISGADLRLVGAHVDVSGRDAGGLLQIGTLSEEFAPAGKRGWLAKSLFVNDSTTLLAHSSGRAGEVVLGAKDRTDFLGTVAAVGRDGGRV